MKNFQLNLEDIFSFPLDDFQQQAIAALNEGKSVVVCAPTGSGKTVIGEYAIYRALANKKRVFYTTPLKALSNQKFRDFEEKFTNQLSAKVGLITGDILINPEAEIVVMTTEIFRNMLYETPIGQVGTSVEDVEAVVFDECHYISDRERGTVWEESIIYCPVSIQIVALSATIGNPEELTQWINQVRACQNPQLRDNCELINSDFRPVPLRFYFSNQKDIYNLLNSKNNKINASLKAESAKLKGRRLRKSDCPNLYQIIDQLRERDMLPAIYVIFSRRGCDQAVEQLNTLTLVNYQEANKIRQIVLRFFLQDDRELQNQVLNNFNNYPIFQEKLKAFCLYPEINIYELIEFLENNLDIELKLLDAITQHSQIARKGELEALTRGIGAHHAGLLPAWKELVEKLFELSLVKIVFATSTLSAGINMPARTTVISALSKRTDEGHRMLTPSEFLQMAGRAGRRGMDTVGHVVTVQTPFETAEDAANLALSSPDPLRSWFNPSYGMVLNLLQKHTIEQAKDLLERSFAEYLAKLQLAPQQQAISAITSELAKIDIELAGFPISDFNSYQKIRERLKEEYKLLEILQQQAILERKKAFMPLIPDLNIGTILYLKGKHVKVGQPLTAILAEKIPTTRRNPDFMCLSNDNRWYLVSAVDIFDISSGAIPESCLENLIIPTLPDGSKIPLGKWRKGNEYTAALVQQIAKYEVPLSTPPQVIEHLKRIAKVQLQLDNHPLEKTENPGYLIKRHKQRIILREQLHKNREKYQKNKSRSSYYWEEFLNLIEVLREFKALDGFTPTYLGEVAATLRGENELWLGLALTSGKLDDLEPHQLASAITALISEPFRPDTWTKYHPSPEVLEALGFKKSETDDQIHQISLWEIKRQLHQVQNRYDVAIPVPLERELIGLVEQWALGVEWNDICDNTTLDQGDIVRNLRRTVDFLWQIPQTPGLPDHIKRNARKAISEMKRFPI